MYWYNIHVFSILDILLIVSICTTCTFFSINIPALIWFAMQRTYCTGVVHRTPVCLIGNLPVDVYSAICYDNNKTCQYSSSIIVLIFCI